MRDYSGKPQVGSDQDDLGQPASQQGGGGPQVLGKDAMPNVPFSPTPPFLPHPTSDRDVLIPAYGYCPGELYDAYISHVKASAIKGTPTQPLVDFVTAEALIRAPRPKQVVESYFQGPPDAKDFHYAAYKVFGALDHIKPTFPSQKKPQSPLDVTIGSTDPSLGHIITDLLSNLEGTRHVFTSTNFNHRGHSYRVTLYRERK